MEADPGTEERALDLGSGFHNHSDTNCAYLCSLNPWSCSRSSVQFSTTPTPDKMKPVTLLIISSLEQVAGLSEHNVDYAARAELYVNTIGFFTQCMGIPCNVLHMSVYSESHLWLN